MSPFDTIRPNASIVELTDSVQKPRVQPAQIYSTSLSWTIFMTSLLSSYSTLNFQEVRAVEGSAWLP